MPGTRLDVPGALTVTAALTALVYGVVETESHGWGSTQTLSVLAVAIALFATAGVIESRAHHPLIPFTILRRGAVATSTTILVIQGAVITSTIYFLSLFLQQIRGYSPFDSGCLLMPFALVSIVTPAFAAPLTTLFGPRRVALASSLTECAGVTWLSRWGAHGSVVTQLVIPSFLIGIGGSILVFSMSVLLTSNIERENSGLGSGLFNAGRQVGSSIGLAALTVLAATRTRSLLAGHHNAIGQATARGYGLALLGDAGLLILGAAVIAKTETRRRVTVAVGPAVSAIRLVPPAADDGRRASASEPALPDDSPGIPCGCRS
jgi:MFS family permease